MILSEVMHDWGLIHQSLVRFFPHPVDAGDIAIAVLSRLDRRGFIDLAPTMQSDNQFFFFKRGSEEIGFHLIETEEGIQLIEGINDAFVAKPKWRLDYKSATCSIFDPLVVVGLAFSVLALLGAYSVWATVMGILFKIGEITDD